jgi:hypothetical protein
MSYNTQYLRKNKLKELKRHTTFIVHFKGLKSKKKWEGRTREVVSSNLLNTKLIGFFKVIFFQERVEIRDFKISKTGPKFNFNIIQAKNIKVGQHVFLNRFFFDKSPNLSTILYQLRKNFHIF